MIKKNLAMICAFIILLTGCMYPEDKLSQNQIPYEDQILSVQNAVTKFQEDSGGLLPIMTKEGTTPIFQKYPIDFKKIVPKYLADSPGNAYENGGIFSYVLVDVETNPTVKLLDLRITEKIREIKLRVKANGGYPPYKEQIGVNAFTIDFGKLGYKEAPFVVSPFTNNNLPFIAGVDGDIYVDYRMDIYQKLQESDLEVTEGQDIRSILLKDSMFVPAYSLPYTIDKDKTEPIFMN